MDMITHIQIFFGLKKIPWTKQVNLYLNCKLVVTRGWYKQAGIMKIRIILLIIQVTNTWMSL